LGGWLSEKDRIAAGDTGPRWSLSAKVKTGLGAMIVVQRVQPG